MSSFQPSDALVDGAFEDFLDGAALDFGGSSLIKAITSFNGIFASGVNSTRGKVSKPMQFQTNG